MRLREELNILIATAIFLPTAVSSSYAATTILRDTLTPSRPLYDGETLVSAGGTFALGFFNPTNSSSGYRYVAIWYHNISSHDIVWVANNRNPVTGSAGSAGSLALTRNGTLIILNHNSTIIWSSSPFTTTTITTTDATAQLLDTGNIIVRDAAADSRNYIWQSFDYPSNTILAGMFIGWNLRTGTNHNITSWSSPTDPSPGAYTSGIHLRGVPQLMVTEGNGSVYWRGGPWLGDRFAGVPEVPSRNVINVTFVRTTEEVGYFTELIGSNVVTRFTANVNGSAQRWVWLEPPGQWSVFWKTPKDQCDAFSSCGAFGVCDADKTPVCSCVPKFRAKDPARWVLRDWTSGCVRNTTLDCRTDGFVPVSGVKLPDTTVAVADYDGRLGLDDCRVRCLMNCSCTAYSLADVTGGGSVCIMWTGELNDMRFYSEGGQELYVRVAAADAVQLTGSTNSNQKRRNLAVILVPIFASLFVGSLLVGGLISRHILRKKKTRKFYRDNEEISNDNDINLPLFDFETISEATNNFSDENKLGEGGFGPVYKGIKEDGKEIAVKRLSKSSTQGLDEFKNEVTLIAKLQHRNLVLLLGSCIQRQERMLIYEYMPNRSLDTFLFDKAKRVLLNWQLRYRIILGIARGLLYLHQDSIVRVIHRDLKASNILLSKEMEPKISDFGLARIFEEEAKSKTKRVVGTYGYMSPEYAMDGIFSVKSDVFSFGVLILEIISGQKNKGIFSSEFNHLIGEAWNLWEEGNTLQLADTSIVDSFSISEVLRCIKVGLLCIQEYPADRPLMRSVFLMLTSDKEVLPEPKRPGFVARRHSFEADQSSSSKQESFTVNEITLTMPHGR